MLFNSDEFLFVFLPIVFGGFLVLGTWGQRRWSALWLTAASLIFYSWWRPANLPLLLFSIAANYLIGGVLVRNASKAVLALGIALNLSLLAYFKYSVIFAESLSGMFALDWNVQHIVLPLAISFFTFQQIAYLVDAFAGKVTERDPLNYCLFITFFPHLIAGPITHHREMLSQFGNASWFRPNWSLIAVGVTLFLIGLFKKVMIADPFGGIASPLFAISAEFGGMQLVQAWTAALAYALQIYFDFSGYSDMAIGLGLLFGIALPPNFNSPYKARNVIEYWSRWHMTLTRFLTAYVYNPVVVMLTRRRADKGLPLPKRGRMTPGTFVTLVALPTVLTMFISGVWHGAGWQFVIFGLLHGFYLVVAHGWRAWKAHRGVPLDAGAPMAIVASVLLTFLCVVVALVFFRAPSATSAIDLLKGMTGLNGVTLPEPLADLPGAGAIAGFFDIPFASLDHIEPSFAVRIVLFLIVVWTLPNAYQWLGEHPSALDFSARASWIDRWPSLLNWRPSPALGIVLGAVCAVTLLYSVSAAPTEFLYFQF